MAIYFNTYIAEYPVTTRQIVLEYKATTASINLQAQECKQIASDTLQQRFSHFITSCLLFSPVHLFVWCFDLWFCLVS